MRFLFIYLFMLKTKLIPLGYNVKENRIIPMSNQTIYTPVQDKMLKELSKEDVQHRETYTVFTQVRLEQ